MTLPALPPKDSTDWYDHYTGLHNVAQEVDDGEFAPVDHTHTVATAPAGSVFVVRRDPVTGNWPSGYDSAGKATYTAGGSASAAVRPTSRSDITIEWEGAIPAPDDVDSGIGGALRGVDRHYIPNA